MVKKLKTLLSVLLLAGIIAVGNFSYVGAKSNTEDKPFSFYGRGSGCTNGRFKYNDSRTYVYPQSGPDATYTVYGSQWYGDGYQKCSESVRLYSGKKYTISNVVNRCYYIYASLDLKGSGACAWTKGVWSPDSSRNYNNVG